MDLTLYYCVEVFVVKYMDDQSIFSEDQKFILNIQPWLYLDLTT